MNNAKITPTEKPNVTLKEKNALYPLHWVSVLTNVKKTTFFLPIKGIFTFKEGFFLIDKFHVWLLVHCIKLCFEQ